MRKYDELWSELNVLLSLLRDGGCDVVQLVDEYFAKHDNPAPALLLRRQIDKLQKRLDEAE
jgi:hypothetical protein